MKKILENIEAIRREKGIKQNVLAEQLGMKQGQYSRYLTQQDDLWLSQILQICDILGTPLNDVVTYPEKYVSADQVIHHCDACKEKDEIIKNLNDYIQLLKSK